MIISVVGDVHGNIDLVYKSIVDWQRKNKKIVDIIFQVGDLGVYDPLKEHSVTPKVLKKNPGEFNLYNYLKNESIYSKFFKSNQPYSSIEAKLFFTRGNHDDDVYLDELEKKEPRQNAHKINDNIYYLSDSRPITIYTEDDEVLTIASVGGIEKDVRPNAYNKNPGIAINDDSVINALEYKNKLDIFLTHMHPIEAKIDGSKDLSDLVNYIEPNYYFYGHLNKSPSSFLINKTKCYGLKRIEFDNASNVEDNSMIFLEKKHNKLKIIDLSKSYNLFE